MAKKENSSEGTVAVEMVKLSTIKPAPNNPRVIKDDKLERLMRSILDFPKMMELRPIIVDEAGTVLGGNMRLKAIKQLGKNWLDWVPSESTSKAQRKVLNRVGN